MLALFKTEGCFTRNNLYVDLRTVQQKIENKEFSIKILSQLMRQNDSKATDPNGDGCSYLVHSNLCKEGFEQDWENNA